MKKSYYFYLFSIILILLHFTIAVSCASEKNIQENIVLTPADQLILNRIDKLSQAMDAKFEKMNDKFEKMNGKFDIMNGRFDIMNARIDNLWITMVGGFIGVMAFIGGMVFWDRKTFLKQAKKEFREEIGDDKKKIEAVLLAIKKLSVKFPEVKEVLNNFGLL